MRFSRYLYCKVQRRDSENMQLSGERQIKTTIRLSVFFQPGTAHIDSITVRAEQALELKMISSMPEISIEPGKIRPFWVIVLTIEPADKPFWFGFYAGKDWCVNNRAITVGCD